MTICLGKSCSFGLMCVSFVKVYLFCVWPFSVLDLMWNLIVLIPDHCLFIYFERENYVE